MPDLSFASARTWLLSPLPTASLGRRLGDARRARGESLRDCAARLGVPAAALWAAERSFGGAGLRARMDEGPPSGPSEPRWRRLVRGTFLLALMVADAPAVVGFVARWTGLRGTAERLGVALVLATAAFLVLRGWRGAGPGGGYAGVEAFLYMRVNNALAFGLLASLVAGWFADVVARAATWRAAAAGSLACGVALWSVGAPLRVVQGDLRLRLEAVGAVHAGFRQEQWSERRRADRDPSYDLADARRTSALRMLRGADLPVAPWMADRRSFALHRSIVAACLEAASRREVEPESCDATAPVVDAPVDRPRTFAFLFRSQFPHVPARDGAEP